MSTKLVNKSQVKNVIKVKGVAGNMLADILMRVLGINKVNEIFSNIYKYQGLEFADKLILPDAPCLLATVEPTERESPKVTLYSA